MHCLFGTYMMHMYAIPPYLIHAYTRRHINVITHLSHTLKPTSSVCTTQYVRDARRPRTCQGFSSRGWGRQIPCGIGPSEKRKCRTSKVSKHAYVYDMIGTYIHTKVNASCVHTWIQTNTHLSFVHVRLIWRSICGLNSASRSGGSGVTSPGSTGGSSDARSLQLEKENKCVPSCIGDYILWMRHFVNKSKRWRNMPHMRMHARMYESIVHRSSRISSKCIRNLDVCTYINIFVYVCMYVCIYAYIYMYIYIYVYSSIEEHMHVYTISYIYINMHIFIYVYIHIHIIRVHNTRT